jgi:signal transduction histidine kinase/ligand-binding sensor domain-containing protein
LTALEGLPDDSILTLTEGRDGSVLVGTTNGFSRIRGADIDSFRPQDGLSQSTVYALFEDREGSLWAATKHGLNQFIDSRAVPYTTSEGLPSNNTGPVLQDRHGVVWVGTLGGGLARFDGRTFVTFTTSDGLTSNTIRTLAEDASGDLWVGADAGLNRLRNGRVVGTWTERNGLPENHVRALYTDQSGSIWIATAKGPAVFRDGRVQAVPDRRTATGDVILAFGETSAREVFAVPDNSAPYARADTIYRDREGLLWVGTLGAGLRLVDGDRTFTFSVLDGLFDDVIYGITEDDQGRLWMACSKGIFSVSREDLKQFAAGTIQRFVSTPYTPIDALRTVECQPGVQPAVTRTNDGRLWFSTIRGLLVIDPRHFERQFVAPAVTVEDVIVNGERKRPAELGTLTPGSKTLEFNYTAASFIAPRGITFRHRLEGVDDAWVEAGSRREAFYSSVAPGSFRFHVAACTPDGLCNESATPVVFSIPPRFYQTAWFLPLCLTGVALGGVAMYRLRIRRMKEQFDLVLAERGRIARELHDTLFQGFSGITMAMQAMVSRLPSSSERRTLEEIVADAGHAMRDARQSVAGLRATDPSTSGLATAVAQTARQLADTGNVKLKLNVAECEVPADVEYNLLRIAQEAVLNAVRHSGARTLRVTLNSTPRHLLLTVRDDGAGFDNNSAVPAGHYGLIGMKERAAQIGADFEITTAPGEGTTVSVRMAS